MTPRKPTGKICPIMSSSDPQFDWINCQREYCQFWQQRDYWTNETEGADRVTVEGCAAGFPAPAQDSNGHIPV